MFSFGYDLDMVYGITIQAAKGKHVTYKCTVYIHRYCMVAAQRSILAEFLGFFQNTIETVTSIEKQGLK